MDERVPAEPATAGGWFCVRCVFRWSGSPGATYEERLTIWQATGFDQAVTLAQADAAEYAGSQRDCTYLGLAQAFHLVDQPGHGAEVFSLMRDSQLDPHAYIDAFFDTGAERQGDIANP